MGSKASQYDIGLDKNAANYVPLTPLSFLARSAAVYPNHVSTVYEGRSFTWAQTYERCRRFASYLAKQGIGEGDTVAAMLPNVPAMNELHFAVAHGRRGAERAQHPARCGLDRLPARPWRRQDHPGRSRICRRDHGCDQADERAEARS